MKKPSPIMKRLRALTKGLDKSYVYNHEGAVLYFTASMLARMKELGITRSDLAKKMGVSRAYISRVLQGTTNFTLESMVKIAIALKAELSPMLRVKGVDVLKRPTK